MRITTRRVLMGIGVLILVLALLTYFTSAGRETKVAVESITAGPKTIGTIVAELRDVPLSVTEVGIVKAKNQVTVIAEASGKVVEVKRDVGDHVRKSEVIIVLEDEIPRLSFDEARGDLIIREASFEKAQKDLERAENLYKSKDISLDGLESSRLAFKNAEGNLLRARALVDIREKQYRDTRISSPIEGIVTSRIPDPGDMVSAATPVAVVVDPESVKVTLGIADTKIPKIREGQSCLITIDAYPDRGFPGIVRSVSLKADDDSGTFPVEVVAPNTDDLSIRSGMVARVSIDIETLKDAILITKDAIEKQHGKEIVFVVEGGRAVERAVTRGPSIGEKTVLTSGVSPGDSVVVVGAENLSDGDPVREGI